MYGLSCIKTLQIYSFSVEKPVLMDMNTYIKSDLFIDSQSILT